METCKSRVSEAHKRDSQNHLTKKMNFYYHLHDKTQPLTFVNNNIK